MKLFLLSIAFLFIATLSVAQSKTTEALNKKHSDSQVLVFYNSTLRMLNQSDDKEFDDLIKEIEKMKLLMITKTDAFGKNEYKKITTDYKAESFEEIMSSRMQGKNFDVYLKEREGKTKGMIILVNDSAKLYVLDIVGRVALEKVNKFYTLLSKNSEIAEKFKSFSGGGDHGKDHSSHH